METLIISYLYIYDRDGALRAHRIEKALHCAALVFKEKSKADIVAEMSLHVPY